MSLTEDIKGISQTMALEMLKQGISPETILRRIRPDNERELLKRCAVVRFFDAALVSEILRPDVAQAVGREAPDMDWLVARPDMELLRDVPRAFRLRPNLSDRPRYYCLAAEERIRQFDAWWPRPDGSSDVELSSDAVRPVSGGATRKGGRFSDAVLSFDAARLVAPDALLALSVQLVDYYRKLGEGWEGDVLHHLIVVDIEQALQLFRQLVKKAVEAFDLKWWQELIRILDDRNSLLSEAMRQERDTSRARLRAYSLRAAAYYRTNYYIDRAVLHTAFTAFLADKQRWILPLYAPGGRGKTMFVEWVTAHHCLSSQTACIHLDFDFLNAAELTQQPWKLIAHLAEQMEAQLPGFRSLHLSLQAEQRKQQPTSGTPDTASTLNQDLLQNAPGMFRRALADAANANQLPQGLIVIFDTLEEVMLHQETDILALVDKVSELRDALKGTMGLHLILSGRYDVAAQLSARYGVEVRNSLRVQPFSDAEAMTFLNARLKNSSDIDVPESKRRIAVQKAQVTPQATSVATGVDSLGEAGANPFLLSLYADLLRSDPEVSEEDLRAYPADVLYLLQRILWRIKSQAVRWLLRYGVVPRMLTLDFVKAVVMPYLEQVATGEIWRKDDPNQDLARRSDQEDNLFDVIKDLKEMQQTSSQDTPIYWLMLSQYAAQYSWVSQPSSDVVVFHSEVLNPMRRLLRGHRIFRELHEKSFEFYQRRASVDPALRGQWLREAVYHRFQLEGESAASYWQTCLNVLDRPDETEARLELALEITGGEYVDGDRPLVWRDSKNEPEALHHMIGVTALADARFEAAWLNMQLARSPNQRNAENFWIKAQMNLSKAETLWAQGHGKAQAPVRLAIVRAALLRRHMDLQQAETLLVDACRLPAMLPVDPQRLTATHCLLYVELGEVLAAQCKAEAAVAAFEKALALKFTVGVIEGILEETEPSNDRLLLHEIPDTAWISGRLASQLAILEQWQPALDHYYAGVSQAVTPGIRLEFQRQTSDLLREMGRMREALQLAQQIERDTPPDDARELCYSILLTARTLYAQGDPVAAQPMCDKLQALLSSNQQTIPYSDIAVLQASHNQLQGEIYGTLMLFSPSMTLLEQAGFAWGSIGRSDQTISCLLHRARIQLYFVGNYHEVEICLQKAEVALATSSSVSHFVQTKLLRAILTRRMGLAGNRAWNIPGRATPSHEALSPRLQVMNALASRYSADSTEGQQTHIRSIIDALQKIDPPIARAAVFEDIRYLSADFPANLSMNLSMESINGTEQSADMEKEADILKSLLVTAVAAARSEAPLLVPSLAAGYLLVGDTKSAFDLLDWTSIEPDAFTPPLIVFQILYAWYVQDKLDVHSCPISALTTFIDSAFVKYPVLCLAGYAMCAWLAIRASDDARLQDALRRVEAYRKLAATIAALTQWNGEIILCSVLLENHFARDNDKKQVEYSDIAARCDESIQIFNAIGQMLRADQIQIIKEALQQPNWKYGDTKLTKGIIGIYPSDDTNSDPSIPPASDDSNRGLGIPPAILVRIKSLGATSTDISVKFPEWQEEQHTIVAEDPIVSEMRNVYGQPFSEALLDRLHASEWQASRALAGLLFNIPQQNAFANLDLDTGLSFRLDLEESSLAAFPWELLHWLDAGGKRALFPPAMYRGNLNVQPIPPSAQPPLKNAMLLQSSVGRQITHETVSISSARELQYSYESAGFETCVLEDPTLDDITRAMKEQSFKVIHICSSLRFAPSSGVFLDFNPDEYNEGKRSAETGSARLVASTIARALPYEHAALIILDVMRPFGQSQVLEQLLLRNIFATELMGLGRVSAILAAGLTLSNEQVTANHRFASMLGQEQTLRDIITETRRAALSSDQPWRPEADSLERIASVPLLSTALFTNTPELRLLRS